MNTVDDVPLGQLAPTVLFRVETLTAEGVWWRATSATTEVAEAVRWRDARRRRLPGLRHEVVEETTSVVRRMVGGVGR